MPQSPERKAAYDKAYNATPQHKKERAQRNAARRELEKVGRVHKGDGKDVDHKRMIKDGGSNASSNLRVVSQKTNRGWRRGQ
jgi:hypothetical protein